MVINSRSVGQSKYCTGKYWKYLCERWVICQMTNCFHQSINKTSRLRPRHICKIWKPICFQIEVSCIYLWNIIPFFSSYIYKIMSISIDEIAIEWVQIVCTCSVHWCTLYCRKILYIKKYINTSFYKMKEQLYRLIWLEYRSDVEYGIETIKLSLYRKLFISMKMEQIKRGSW